MKVWIHSQCLEGHRQQFNCVGSNGAGIGPFLRQMESLSPFRPSQGISEGVVVNERQSNHIRSVISCLEQHELRLRRYVERSTAPLWRHPPELASRACQEPLASELQGKQGAVRAAHVAQSHKGCPDGSGKGNTAGGEALCCPTLASTIACSMHMPDISGR